MLKEHWKNLDKITIDQKNSCNMHFLAVIILQPLVVPKREPIFTIFTAPTCAGTQGRGHLNAENAGSQKVTEKQWFL